MSVGLLFTGVRGRRAKTTDQCQVQSGRGRLSWRWTGSFQDSQRGGRTESHGGDRRTYAAGRWTSKRSVRKEGSRSEVCRSFPK